MKRLLLGLLAALSMVAFSEAARANTIPSPVVFVDALTLSCPAHCASVGLAADPLGAATTVMYTLNLTIPSVVAGDVWVRDFGSSVISSIIRFENVDGKTVVFIYSANSGKGLPEDLFATPVEVISEDANQFAGPYTPGYQQPGYCPSCIIALSYELRLNGRVPEPATLLLLGSGLLVMSLAGRRTWSMWRKRRSH